MATVDSNVPSGGNGDKVPPPVYVATSQQATNGAVVPHLPPNNHMCLAWFSCLCCCWPLGLFAIFTACAVHDHFANGDIERANKAAKTARNASIVAILLGIALFTVNAVYYGSDARAIYYGDEADT